MPVFSFGHVSVDGPGATRQDAWRAWLRSVVGELMDEDGQPPDRATIRAHVLARFREERRRILDDSDWIFLNRSPATAETIDAWDTFRQALRDLPQQYPDLRDAVLPDEPEV